MTRLERLELEKQLLENAMQSLNANLKILIDINNFPKDALNEYDLVIGRETSYDEYTRAIKENFYDDIEAYVESIRKLNYAISMKDWVIMKEEKNDKS